MALETLRGKKKIGGFGADYFIAEPHAFENEISEEYIAVGSDNTLHFKMQDGPVKENGVNGCQVDTLIETAKVIIEGLNKKFPCDENIRAIGYLGLALKFLNQRKMDREARGVEGRSKK